MSVKKEMPEVTLNNNGWGIYTDCEKSPKWATNFVIEILDKIIVHRIPEVKPGVNIRLRLCFEDGGYSSDITMPLSGLDKIKWTDMDERCLLNPNISEAKAQRHIVNNIRESLPLVESKTQYRLNRVGMQSVEGVNVFAAGGEVIRPPRAGGDEPIIEVEGVSYVLDYDPELTEQEAIAEMFELVSLFPDVGRMLLAYNLMSFMRELYVFAWKPPHFCFYVHGESDSRKTTLTTFFSQLYGRSKGIVRPPRLDSSIPKLVRILYSTSDCAKVFDDLCPSHSKEMQRQQEKAFLQIVRIVGDGIKPERVDAKETVSEMPPPTVGVILTGEYFIEDAKPSDIARMLPIEVSPPDEATLQKLAVFQQDKSLVVSTLYRNFICWIIANYDQLKSLLQEWWSIYSEPGFTAHGTKVHGRLKETHYYLNTAYVMFLEYCTEAGCISEDKAMVLHQSFLQLLTGLVQAQQARYEQAKLQKKPEVIVDYVAFVRKLYAEGRFRMASTSKGFNSLLYDGVVHINRLYLHGDNFRNILEGMNADVDEVLEGLATQGALVDGSDGRTIQLAIGDNKKVRCYAIFLSHLK